MLFVVRHRPFNQPSYEIRNRAAFQLLVGGFNQALLQFVIEANRDALIPIAICWRHGLLTILFVADQINSAALPIQ